MAKFDSPLDGVRIAAPCNADWDNMIGTDRVRFCGQCNLNVYNLSSLTRQEAESFITRNEGRLCVRFYRRRDGSVLTENCPVGLRAIRRRLSNVARTVATAVLSFLYGLGVYEVTSSVRVRNEPLMGVMTQEMGGIEPLIEVPNTFQHGLVEIGKVAPRQRLASRQKKKPGDIQVDREGNQPDRI